MLENDNKHKIGVSVSEESRDILDQLPRFSRSEFVDKAILKYSQFKKLPVEAQIKVDRILSKDA